MTRQAGFTLVELLLGVALGAAAIAAAGLGLTAVLDLRSRVDAGSDRIEALAAARTLADRLLAAATPAPGPEGEGFAFEGDAAGAAFIATLWGDVGRAGLWEVRLSLTADGAAGRLLLLGRPYEPAPPGAAPVAGGQRPPMQVLAEARTDPRARLAYGASDTSGALIWAETWRGRDGWPSLIAFDPDGPDGLSPAQIASPIQPRSAP